MFSWSSSRVTFARLSGTFEPTQPIPPLGEVVDRSPPLGPSPQWPVEGLHPGDADVVALQSFDATGRTTSTRTVAHALLPQREYSGN